MKPKHPNLSSPKHISKLGMLVFMSAFAFIGGLILYKSFALNPNLPGDVNNDNIVNITDLSILLTNYSTNYPAADFNSDSTVNILDLSILLTHYNQTYTPPNPTPNPPTPPPTPPPSGGTSTCPLPAYPDASCTGVPAGVTLTTYTGPTDLAANTVIDGKLITKCLYTNQPGVIIRNSRINCGQGGVDVWVTSTNQANWAQIIDSEVICTGGGSGIGERGFIVRRVEVRGCENGFDFDQDGIVEDSYIHSLDEGPNGDGHGDGIQSALLINVTIRHNTIIGRSGDLASPGRNATSAIITPPNGTKDTLIEQNFLAGGAYTLYCPENSPLNVRVLNNTFAHRPGPLGGEYGYTDGCDSGTIFSGNTTDTGQAVNP